MIPDIDYFKSNAKVIQYFGLGFVQIKINENTRFHFYNSDLVVTAQDDIHNHRCGFKSTILTGSLNENIYSVSQGDEYYVKVSKCQKGVKNELLDLKVDAKLIMSTTYYRGSHYFRYPNEFHTVSATHCITELFLFLPKSENALVLIENKENIDYCPFVAEYSTEDLWELVNNTINIGKNK